MEEVDRINSILFKDWDPIGINDSIDWLDEYERYAGIIYRRLRKGNAVVSDIEQLLEVFEVKYITITIDPVQRRKVAENILNTFKS